MIATRTGWRVAVVLAACLVANAIWIGGHLDQLRPLMAGHPAPPLALPRIGPTGAVDGPVVDLAASRGKVVVVDFWATWCQPCLASLPQLDRASRRWGDRVTMIAANVDDPAEARALFTDSGYQLTLVASDEATEARYGVYSYPRTVVIDAAGVVRLITSRAGAAEAAVDRLLAASAHR